MKVYVMCDSITGNTTLLANVIKEKYKNELTDQLDDAELVFVGSWTDKGMCSNKIKTFLSNLKNKKVFLFGTCGFGGDKTYYDKIYERTASFIDSSNEIIGCYYCQGKMPMTIKDRYETLLKANPLDKDLQVSLDNFIEALKHPNEEDLKNLLDLLNTLKYHV